MPVRSSTAVSGGAAIRATVLATTPVGVCVPWISTYAPTTRSADEPPVNCAVLASIGLSAHDK